MQIQLAELEPEREFKSTVELDQDVIVFGRGRPGDGFVALPKCAGNWISKSHCTIWKDGQKWFICDGELGGNPSKNGVLLEGELIKGPVQLRLGQVFTLLVPPPCEIQLRVVEGHADLEDTLTPAIRHMVSGPESLAAVDELKDAITVLHGQLAENRNLDETLRGEVAAASAARAKQEKALSVSMSGFQQMSQRAENRLEFMEKRQTWLTRMVSGLALGVAVVLLAISTPADDGQRGLSLERGLELLLMVAGGGGLAAAGRFQHFGEGDDEDRFVASDELGYPRSLTGDAGAGEFAQGGRFPFSGGSRSARTVGEDQRGHRGGGRF